MQECHVPIAGISTIERQSAATGGVMFEGYEREYQPRSDGSIAAEDDAMLRQPHDEIEDPYVERLVEEDEDEDDDEE
jgi:hypothetical protein